jgi:hypothetical protein
VVPVAFLPVLLAEQTTTSLFDSRYTLCGRVISFLLPTEFSTVAQTYVPDNVLGDLDRKFAHACASKFLHNPAVAACVF